MKRMNINQKMQHYQEKMIIEIGKLTWKVFCTLFFCFSLEMSNGTSYIDDILPKQNSDTVLIKLQADTDGRYGFNVKVND